MYIAIQVYNMYLDVKIIIQLVLIYRYSHVIINSCRCSVMQGQLKLSLEKNKNLSKEKIQLERDLVSSRRMLQQKKEELEKYYEKLEYLFIRYYIICMYCYMLYVYRFHT